MDFIVRNYRPTDFEAVKKIHEEGGIDYKTPDFNSPLFIVKKVVEFDGKVVCALLWRIEAETYLMLDKGEWGDPAQKLEAIRLAQIDGLDDLWMQGIDNAVAFIPEHINKHFAKRLEQLGWKRGREGWIGWSRPTLQETKQ
jgi:hypothetical protein